MYHVKIFDKDPELELERFLNNHHIPSENIISISMSSDSDATERFSEQSVNRILLVYVT